MNQQVLSNLKAGAVAYVSSVSGNSVIKKHMANAGFFKGSKVVVLNVSPYTSCFLLDVCGRVLALKKGAVSLINVNLYK